MPSRRARPLSWQPTRHEAGTSRFDRVEVSVDPWRVTLGAGWHEWMPYADMWTCTHAEYPTALREKVHERLGDAGLAFVDDALATAPQRYPLVYAEDRQLAAQWAALPTEPMPADRPQIPETWGPLTAGGVTWKGGDPYIVLASGARHLVGNRPRRAVARGDTLWFCSGSLLVVSAGRIPPWIPALRERWALSSDALMKGDGYGGDALGWFSVAVRTPAGSALHDTLGKSFAFRVDVKHGIVARSA